MKEERQQSLPRQLTSVWAQAVLVFLLALLPRLIALSKPFHHNEFKYAINARDLLVTLLQRTGGPLPGIGSFRAVTLTWESAILLYTRYWLHLTQIWPASLPDTISLQQFLAFETTHPMEVLFTMRLSTVLTSALGSVLIYVLSRQLWGWRSAALVTAFVSLDPFFLGFSRLLNTDGHVATWTGVALLALLAYLDQGGIRLAAVTVLATGLALVSKPSATFLLGFLPLAAIGYGLALKGRDYKEIRRMVWGMLVIVGVVLLWQVTAWLAGRGQDFFTAILGTLRNYATKPGELKFSMGETLYSPRWTFYPAVLLARTTPGIVAGVFLGTIALLKTRDGSTRWKKEAARWVILASFVAMFTTFISPANIKIDRYLLPAYPALGVMGARGVLLFWQWAKGCHPSLLFKAGAAWLAFAHLVAVLVTFPYYTTYRTPFLGRKVVDFIQIGYGEGLGQVADYLNHKPDADTLSVISWYGQEVMEPQFKGITWQPQTIYGDTVATPQNIHLPSFFTADYVVTYINQVQRGLPDPQLISYFESRQPEMQVWLMGLPYASLYPGPIYGSSVPEEAVVLTYPSTTPLHLLAYQLEGLDIEDADNYALTLFWQTQASLAKDYTVVIKLLSEDGKVWGSSDGWPVGGLLPTSLWEPGVIVRDDYRLDPLPGTPPGAYYLEVALVDSVSGQPLPLTSGEIGPGGGLVLQTITLEHPARLQYRAETASSSVKVPEQRDVAKGVKLLGYSPASWSERRTGESLPLTMLWQATRTAPPGISLRWQLTGDDSTTVALGTSSPGTDRYPLSRWQKREIVRDQFALRLPADLESGIYQLRARLPDATTLEIGTVQVIARQHTFEIPYMTHTLDVSFGEIARLLGYDLDLTQVESGGPARLTLYWQAQKESEIAYKVFVHLLDGSGQIVTQVDQEPQAGKTPTTSWLLGEVVVDDIRIAITEATAATQSIAVGLYDPMTGERLPVRSTDGTVLGDSVMLSAQ